MPTSDDAAKSWWRLSKSTTSREFRQTYMDVKADRRTNNAAKPSKGLKSLAVAIGLKAKKTSKEPLFSDYPDRSITEKSPSSTPSPVSPYDTRLLRPPRQSLLTLADDPFAGQPPVVFVPVPDRLSVYSGSSATDLASQNIIDSPVYRSSYASSSTNSNSFGPDNNIHHAFPESKKLHLKRSIRSMNSALTEPVKPRSRGMTVGSLPQKSLFFVDNTPDAPNSRLIAPPTSPPTVDLPAPPQHPIFRQRKGLNTLPLSSSSSLSLSNDNSTLLNHDLNVEDDFFDQSLDLLPKPTPRTLKKPPSQRSLRRTASPTSSISSKVTIPDYLEKKKQRNSHQSRLPMPTLSLSIRTSFVSTSPSLRNDDPTSPGTINERKPRKRLFSTCSQRPSTSTSLPPSICEDDTSSVSSLHDTIRTPYTPWAVTRNYPKSSSFWDESLDNTSTSPTTLIADYQPQAIMSRDELAKFDASLSNPKPDQETESGIPIPDPNVLGVESNRVALSPPPSIKSRHSFRRPSVKVEVDIENRHGGSSASASATLNTIPDWTSLPPPPPRRRLLSSNSVRSTSTTTSTTSTLITSPIDRSRGKSMERPSTAIPTSKPPPLPVVVKGGSLTGAPPVSRTLSRGKPRTSGVLEKAIHRRSIMRKPSFLEIDGESDRESELQVSEKRDSLFLNMKSLPTVNGSSKTGESFLDFARESFDTVRS